MSHVHTTIHPVLRNITTPKMFSIHDVNTPVTKIYEEIETILFTYLQLLQHIFQQLTYNLQREGGILRSLLKCFYKSYIAFKGVIPYIVIGGSSGILKGTTKRYQDLDLLCVAQKLI